MKGRERFFTLLDPSGIPNRSPLENPSHFDGIYQERCFFSMGELLVSGRVPTVTVVLGRAQFKSQTFRCYWEGFPRELLQLALRLGHLACARWFRWFGWPRRVDGLGLMMLEEIR